MSSTAPALPQSPTVQVPPPACPPLDGRASSPAGVGAPIPPPAGVSTLWLASINRVRHIVRLSEVDGLTVVTAECGAVGDSVHDDLTSRPDTNCPACIPFRRTR